MSATWSRQTAGSLLVIQRLDPIYADFTVTESELDAVQRNMANAVCSVEVRLPDDSDQPREGKLTFLDNSVQDGTGTVKLRATIANSDRRFWPGRFAKFVSFSAPARMRFWCRPRPHKCRLKGRSSTWLKMIHRLNSGR